MKKNSLYSIAAHSTGKTLLHLNTEHRGGKKSVLLVCQGILWHPSQCDPHTNW